MGELISRAKIWQPGQKKNLYFISVILTILANTRKINASTTTSGILDVSQTTGTLQSIINFSTGPIAKTIAVIATMSVIWMFVRYQDRLPNTELNQGLNGLTILAIVLGLLLGGINIFGTAVGTRI